MATTRCGHTNMHHYFGIEPYKQYSTTAFYRWIFSENRVVVLRDPIERIISTLAVNAIAIENKIDFVDHTCPYLHKIKRYDFRVIDFAKLEQYIPRPTDYQSPRTDSSATCNLAKLYHVPNDTYTLRELEQECEDYMYLMSHRKHLSIKEWKELTL